MEPLLFPGAILVWLVAVAALLASHRRELLRLWREPVFRRPVVVLESDDWGAGPLSQAEALDQIASVLSRHRDAQGLPALLNLAVVLAVPDGPAIASSGAYHRIELDQVGQAPILEAMRRGEAAGVFSLQLHGLEHYWPPSVMASPDEKVQAWLHSSVLGSTEDLPAALQSRWVDARQLPTRPLAPAAIAAAVADEVQTYTRVFGQPPVTVVPPTFVWTPDVERAWMAQGLLGVVTPGQRYTARDAAGLSVADSARFANGDRHDALTYLVRSDYFEPIKGRGATHALGAVQLARSEGRACLLENHRVNFCRDDVTRLHSLAELDALVGGVLVTAPQTCFLSTHALRQLLVERNPDWIASQWRERLPYWWRRVQRTGRLWKLMRWSGAATFLSLVLGPLARGGMVAHG